MDERAAKICERAFQALDSVDARLAEPQAETPDQQYAREARERDDFNAEQERLEREGFKQKRLEREQKLQSKVQPGMTHDDRAWVQHQLDLCIRSISRCVTEDDEKVLAQVRTLKAEVKTLREEIGQLRAEVTLLQAHRLDRPNVSAEGSITSLRHRSVA